MPEPDDASLIVAIISLITSAVALLITLYDRRARLFLHARKGEWFTLEPTFDKTEVIFRGIVELYNRSSRPNAVRRYEFWCKRREKGANWEHMDSEYYRETSSSIREKSVDIANVTPLALEPYSGTEAKVMAFTKMPQPFVMDIRIEVEDLFGRRYRTEVEAKS